MDLIRDVLDNQIVDRKQQKMGKVDGIVVELRDGKPPRVAHIEMGGSILAQRLHPQLGRWAVALGRRWGLRHGEPVRIPWDMVSDIGIDVQVDLEAEQTLALVWERWLREHVIGRIPGA